MPSHSILKSIATTQTYTFETLHVIMEKDINIFSADNLVAQAAITPLINGYHALQFYVTNNGQLAKERTDTLGLFYLSPSGGALRDEKMNIVLYSARYDKFKGYGKA